ALPELGLACRILKEGAKKVNSQKKELLKSISILEKRIKIEKYKENRDVLYFSRLRQRHQYTLTAILIPAFLIGWRGGKSARGKHLIQRVGKYSLLGLYKIFSNYNK